MRLRVVDIETTGDAPPAEIIEFGRVDVESLGEAWTFGKPMARLYRPLRGITPETMAVHHITEADIPSDAPVCTDDKLRQAVWGGEPPDALVAHNSDFERAFIPEAITSPLPWICTLKAALRVWPDAPRHSNQVLRYWRDLKLDRALASPPHRAAPDAYVTAHLVVELLKHASIEELIAWTKEPRLLPKMTFGKHRGTPWSEVPTDYLDWMLRQSDMDPDAVWCARNELDRRKLQPSTDPERQAPRAMSKAFGGE